MDLKTRWERGQKNTKREVVTSSSEARSEWKNPLSGDPNKLAQARVTLKGLGLKVGMSWKF